MKCVWCSDLKEFYFSFIEFCVYFFVIAFEVAMKDCSNLKVRENMKDVYCSATKLFGGMPLICGAVVGGFRKRSDVVTLNLFNEAVIFPTQVRESPSSKFRRAYYCYREEIGESYVFELSNIDASNATLLIPEGDSFLLEKHIKDLSVVMCQDDSEPSTSTGIRHMGSKDIESSVEIVINSDEGTDVEDNCVPERIEVDSIDVSDADTCEVEASGPTIEEFTVHGSKEEEQDSEVGLNVDNVQDEFIPVFDDINVDHGDSNQLPVGGSDLEAQDGNTGVILSPVHDPVMSNDVWFTSPLVLPGSSSVFNLPVMPDFDLGIDMPSISPDTGFGLDCMD